jgi:hypothetical protein
VRNNSQPGVFPSPHNKGKKTREVEAMEVELKKRRKTFLEAKFF